MKKYFYAALALSILVTGCNSEKPSKQEEQEKQASVEKTETTTVIPKDTIQKVDTIRGIDVSHYQGNVKWQEIKNAGMHFGIAKSTQGETYTDPEFENNWKNISASGLYRGTYHFYVPQDDPIKQAEHFVNTVKSIGKHHIPPALDLEGENIGGLGLEKYHTDVLKWLQYVEDSLKIRPLIYTNHPFGNKYLDNEKFDEYKLWVAEYGAVKAQIPISWEKIGWTGWQFTSHDTLSGVKGSVDESHFLSSILIQEQD